jgi:hypothetical protein
VIGVDFDNTIVCYDDLFHRVAVERGLMPASVPAAKGAVRAHLEERHGPDCWTELQGYVYGARMADAVAFPGVREFFRRCADRGWPLCIISHKTCIPAKGPPYDLHRAALEWLQMQGFLDGVGLNREHVIFALTQEEKVRRIAEAGCRVFIDDLPEVLTKPGFPADVRRVLFDPHRQHSPEAGIDHTGSWTEIEQLLQCSHPTN